MRAFSEATRIRMRGILGLAALSLISGLFSQPAVGQAKPAPDVIVFKNGDKLTGTLIRGTDANVIFKSDVVGQVTVPMDKIQELQTHGTFVVIKKNEQITRTSKQPGNMTYSDGTVTVATKAGPETVPTSNLGYIVDDATFTKEVIRNPGFFHGWDGSVTAGLTVLQATNYGETFTAAASLVRAIPSVSYLPSRTRTIFNLLETYGKLTEPTIPPTIPPTPASVTKTSIFHMDFEHDKYFSSRFYMLGDVIYDHNISQGLDLQQIYGGGAGYTAIKDAVQQLDFKTDIHYERQNFTQYAPPAISTPDTNLIGSTFAEAYRRTLPGKIKLTQGAIWIQSWNNTSAYSAIGALGLALPVYHHFSFSMNLLDTYLNNPAAGYQKNSLQFITGVTYTLH